LYREAFTHRNTQKIAKAIAENGGEANYKQIADKTKLPGSTIIYHLNRLIAYKIVESPVKGYYRLKRKAPLCYIYQDTTIPTVYFGLLGIKEDRSEPEPLTAIKLLKKEKINPTQQYVVTTPEALEEWKNHQLPYKWILCYNDEIRNIEAIRSKVKPTLENLLTNNLAILDCTSATKPATLAYYKLAQEYHLPLIYVNEKPLEIVWLNSREDIVKTLMTEPE